MEIPHDGYLYADHARELIDVAEGITVEVRMCFADQPVEGVYWPLVAKPGSYAITIRGRDPTDGSDQYHPIETVLLSCVTQGPRPGSCGAGGGGFTFRPGRNPWPLETWVHLAYQVLGNTDVEWCKWFFDGRSYGGRSSSIPGIGWLDRPFFIGGLGPDAIGEDPCTSFRHRRLQARTMRGWVDEVRVSRGWRYGESQITIEPVRGASPDADTIALWTFDEPPSSGAFEDVSGNGQTLFVIGSVATSVSTGGQLTAKWAHLKRQ